MKCKTKAVYTPINGNKSILFEELNKSLGDEGAALDLWASVYTPEFKRIIGDWTSENYEGALDANGEPVLADILRGEHMENAEIKKRAIKDSEKYVRDLDALAKNTVKTRDLLIRRIKELEGSETEGSERMKKRLVTLKNNLKKLDWKESTLEFSKTAVTSVNYAATRMDKELAKANPDSRTLRKFNSFLTAFDILNDIRDQIDSNDLMKGVLPEAAEDRISRVIRQKDVAKKKYQDFIKRETAEVLSERSAGKHTADYIESLLEKAPFDISARSRWLFFAGDSRDPVVALVAKLVNEQQQKTRHTSIEFSHTLGQKLEAMESERSEFKGNAEKMYAPFLLKSPTGELTGYFISEKDTPKQYKEFYDKYKGTKTFEFYEFFTKEYERLNSIIPAGYDMGNRLPSLLKSTLESLLTQGDKTDKVKRSFRDMVEASNLDTETGQLLDDSNRAIDSIPVHFTTTFDSSVYKSEYRKLLKTGKEEDVAHEEAMEIASAALAKNISYDLGASIQAFQYMAENYANMEEIIGVVDGAKQLLFTRDVSVTTSKGKAILSKMKDFEGDTLGDPVQSKSGAESNSYKLLEAFIAMQVYGQTEQDIGSFSLGNMQIEGRKLAKIVGKYNSTLLMGFNVLAGSANIMMGETMQWADAFGGEYYSPKDYIKASGEYTKDLGNMIADIGRRIPKSRVGLFSEYYDFLGDYFPSDMSAKTSSTARRIYQNSSLFFISSGGEHMMQNRAAISIFLNTETFDANGKKIGNLWDAHKAEDGKLKIDDVYVKKNGELVKYDQKEKEYMSRRVQAILRLMHGNYNSKTAAIWQRNALFGLVGQFRKWITDGMDRRFGGEKYNYFLEQDREGNYISTGKFLVGLVGDLTRTKFEIGRDWNSMTKHQRANVWRTVTEVAAVTMLAGASFALKGLMDGLDEDDDKDKLANLRRLTYFVNRSSLEITSFVNPFDLWEILRSPAAAMSVIETTSRSLMLIMPWNWDQEYPDGRNKLYTNMKKQIPVWKQIERLSPDGIRDQVKFLQY